MEITRLVWVEDINAEPWTEATSYIDSVQEEFPFLRQADSGNCENSVFANWKCIFSYTRWKCCSNFTWHDSIRDTFLWRWERGRLPEQSRGLIIYIHETERTWRLLLLLFPLSSLEPVSSHTTYIQIKRPRTPRLLPNSHARGAVRQSGFARTSDPGGLTGW